MGRLRLTVQLLFTIVTNGYLYGFLSGKIYRGTLKYACVPGLNCYSCPGTQAYFREIGRASCRERV